MAIQMRRGKFTNFLPSKLQPGEWAIVQGEDPSASDGLSVYVAFAAGVVKRMATYTDMVDNCRDAIEQSIGDIKAKLTAKVEATNATVEDAETNRVAAEASRVSAESSRVSAEQGRVEAESSRVSAESSRKSAEEKRAADQLKNNADQAQNNAAAKGLTYKVCGTGEYNLDAVDGAHNVPTVIGRDGTMYLTPKVDGATDEDKYDQWMYIDSKWELMGESGAHIDPTTTGDVDTIVSGTNVTADRYLNSTGLSYFWVKAVERLGGLFAPKAHSHTVDDVTGTVAIENGGTGATTAADALTNLGAASQTDVDALRDSVSQDIGATTYSQVSGLYLNTYECLAGVCVGCNVSPSASVSAGNTLFTVTTGRKFTSGGKIILRGVFPNKQPGVYVNYGSDGHTIKVTLEQSVSLAAQDTFNFLIPVAWEL